MEDNLERILKNTKVNEDLVTESRNKIWENLSNKYNFINREMENNRKSTLMYKWLALCSFALLFVFAGLVYTFYPPFKVGVDNTLSWNKPNNNSNQNQNNDTKQKVSLASNVTSSVIIDGKLYGTTPVEIELPYGNYSVVFKSQGYQDKVVAITVNASGEIKLNESLNQISFDPYADWSTYRNEKYGFGFKYPKEWKVSEQKKSDSEFIVNIADGSASYAVTYSLVGEQNYRNEPLRDFDEGKITSITKSSKQIGAQREIKVSALESKSDGQAQLVDKAVAKYVFASAADYEKNEKKETLNNWLLSLYCYQVDSGLDFDKIDQQYSQNKFNKVPPKSSIAPSTIFSKGIDNNIKLYSLELATGKTKELNAVNTSFSPIFGYNGSLTDPNGKYIIYVDKDNFVYANNLALSEEVQLFRGYSNTKYSVSMTLTNISPDSRFLIYEVNISDNAKCLASYDRANECDTIPSAFGWKSGYYIYDLKGEFGNKYLVDHKTVSTYSYYQELDWSSDAKNIYILNETDTKISKYTLNTKGVFSKVSEFSISLAENEQFVYFDFITDTDGRYGIVSTPEDDSAALVEYITSAKLEGGKIMPVGDQKLEVSLYSLELSKNGKILMPSYSFPTYYEMNASGQYAPIDSKVSVPENYSSSVYLYSDNIALIQESSYGDNDKVVDTYVLYDLKAKKVIKTEANVPYMWISPLGKIGG